jgi:hypothetical protein
VVTSKKKESADNTGDAVEPLSLTVGTFDGICLRKVHPFRYPAFRAVGKRGGFHKFPAYPEFPAVNAEPAVLERFLFSRKALDPASGCRQDAIILVSHRGINLV